MIPAVLLVALVAPVVVVASSPELRRRARRRWDARQLASTNLATRRAAVDRLLAVGGADLDALFPEVVAAAVMNVSSRAVWVGREKILDERDAVVMRALSRSGGWLQTQSCFEFERRLTAVPRRLSQEKLDPARPLWRVGSGRSLFVAADEELQIVVPLNGEQGERILAAVEERLRRGE